jgi:[ribosomal protein S5]-alanine N-acetyltransferase
MPRLLPPFLPSGSLNGRHQPTIDVNERVVLRPWTLTDVPVVVAAYSDPEIQKWIPYVYDSAGAAEVVERWRGAWTTESGACWAIATRTDGAAFGRMAFQTIDFALSEWAFQQLGLHRIQLLHSTQNVASCQVAKKAHFELEGTLKSAGLYADGWHDVHLHARVSA